MKDLEAGDQFGRYRIERLLGSGGMGRVYAARDSVLRRRVAIKLLHSLGRDDAAPEVLLREARAAAAITHPNAVAIYDVGEQEGVPFIAMEMLEGRPLRAYVGDATVSTTRKVRWLVGVARALGAAHEAGLVHRDVKPGNVLVTTDDTVKVLDFGIAKRTIFHDDATGEPETALGNVKGTPRYMAPEQLAGDVVDARSDQFAWGVLAYELFCGVHPWSTIATDTPLAEIVLTQDPRPPSKVAPNVPPAIEAIILRSMSKDPVDRYATMTALAAELERALEGADEEKRDATADTRVEVIAPTASQQAPAVKKRTLAVFAGVVIAVWVAFLVVRSRKEPPQMAADAAPVPTPVMARPQPTSAHPDAVVAYISARQALHDASMPLAHSELERALSIDPGLAVASLDLALMEEVTDVPRAREHYQQAVAMRTTLDRRDQALLEAIEPYVGRDPSNANEAAIRLRTLADRYPGDAELQEKLATAEMHGGAMKAVIDAASRAIAIDATFAQAYTLRGEARAYLGEFDAAERDFDQCLVIAPSAASCRAYRTQVRLRTVGCGGIEPDAREWISTSPTYFMGHTLLAAVEIDHGDDRTAIDEALHQALERETGSARTTDEIWFSSSSSILRGDFETARQTGEKWLGSVNSNQAVDHERPTRMLLYLYDEMGKTEDAARVAREFLARSPSWTFATQGEDYALADDLRPLAMAFANRARLASDRERWADDWRKRVPEFYAPYIWATGYARTASTREEAIEVLSALPRFGGSPPVFNPRSNADAYAGHAFLLADRAAEALPYLERGAKQCALYWPIEQTRALRDFAEALAAKGDTTAACTALRRVLDRWGAAKRSITATAARARAHALGCDGDKMR